VDAQPINYPLSCGCRLDSGDTAGSILGVIVCQHGRRLFAPFVTGVQFESLPIKEHKTHLTDPRAW
jgi:hypothetical protein